MAYIRTKKISDKPYAYLVENVSTHKGPRQKVKQYLGRVHQFENSSNNKKIISANNKKDFLKQLIQNHLENHGFKEKSSLIINNKIVFSKNNLSFKKGVLSINEGYLCNFTIGRLLDFKKTKNLQKDGTLLAKHFLTAGLPVSQEEFVMFYQML